MGFTKFTKNVLNVSALPDRVQNQASSLKLVFDQAGVDIKAALNALISELEAKVAAANIGADVASVTEKNVQGILTAFENEIANRYTKAETNNAILADTNELIADVKIDLATGLLTVTKKNGTKQTFETSTEAESYAVGGTGTRPGEDTDNAKYYAQIAKQVAGGDFVTVVEMEGYAQKKGLYPNYDETELKGEVIETETTLEAESVLKVHGNSAQETRSGKNLYDENNAPNTFIVNKDEMEYPTNGSLVISGIFEENTQYTFQAQLRQIASGTYARLRVYYTDGTSTDTMLAGTTEYEYETYTSTAGKTIDKVTSYGGNHLYVKRGTFQIEKGTVATAYEPYGLAPSPEVDGHINSVKSKSDNILKLFANSGSVTNAGVTVEMIDYNTVKLNGTATKDAWVELLYKFGNDTAPTTEIGIPLENIKYTASCFISSGSVNKAGAKISFVTTDGTTEYQCAVEYGRQKVFDGKNGLGRIFISLGNGVTYNNLVIKLQVNKGAVALPYRPYGYVPVEARVEGKNKIDLNKCVLVGEAPVNTGDTISYNVINSNKIEITFKGGWTRVVCTKEGLKPNTSYTISALVNNPNGVNCGLYGSSSDTLNTSTATSFTTVITKSTDANGTLNFILFTNWSNDSVSATITYDEIQVEEGTTATSFGTSPKTVSLPLGDIELRSTPDGTRDTFSKVDGVWNVVGNIGKYSLDNTGDIRINESYSSENYRCFYYNKTNGVWANAGTSGYTEKFQIVTTVKELDSLDKPVMYLSGGTYKQVFIKVKNDITTADEFKAQIVNTPIDVIVPLATPTYTPITDQALISALDELEQLILHKGYNRITVTGVNGVKAQLELEIAPTALLTNISETEAGLNMPVPVVSEAGDVLVKVPKAENQMTINPATGVVNVKGLTINGVSLDAYIRSIVG